MNDLQNLEDAAIQIRGHIIHRTSDLEIMIDLYIAQYFTLLEEKAMEMCTLILTPRVSFSEKRLIFKYLIDKYNPEFLKSYPKFHQDLSKIMDERNIMAHYQLNTSEKALHNYKNHGLVYFMKLKNSLEAIEYNNTKVTEIINLIYDYTEAIRSNLRK